MLGYRTDRFPGFYLTESDFPAPWRVESAAQAAAVARARYELGTEGERGCGGESAPAR